MAATNLWAIDTGGAKPLHGYIFAPCAVFLHWWTTLDYLYVCPSTSTGVRVSRSVRGYEQLNCSISLVFNGFASYCLLLSNLIELGR